MSDYVKLAAEAGDQYLAALSESQETFLKSLAPMSELATSVPPMAMPTFAPDLPTPQEIIEANFAFASKLLKQQKKFSDKFLASVPAS